MKPPRISMTLLILMNIGLALLGGPWAWLNVFAVGLLMGVLIAMEAFYYCDKHR